MHSVGLRKSSMMAAKWSLYTGMGGVVCWKSRGQRVAFGELSLRKKGDIEVIVIVSSLRICSAGACGGNTNLEVFCGIGDL